MRIALILSTLAILAACGADAPPFPKDRKSDRDTRPTGLTVSGEARVGVVGTF